jgi:uncharacterized protein (TIGR02391 family)
MLQELIIEGRKLLEKVCKHYVQDPQTLSADQRVHVSELDAWYKAVERVLRRSLPHEASSWWDRILAWRNQYIDAVAQGEEPGQELVVGQLMEAIGILTEIRLANAQPKNAAADGMPFHALHARIRDKCAALYSAGEYDSAVFMAFRTVEEALRQKLGAAATDLGVMLVSTAFSQKDPKLLVSDVPAEQEAIHALFRGAIGSFKNPLSHRSVGHSDPSRVFELVALASLLLRIIDEATIKEPSKTP